MRKILVLLAGAFLCAHAALTVVPDGKKWAIMRDGKPFVRRVEMGYFDNREPSKKQYSYQELPDGTKVWNEWNEGSELRYRLEVAQHTDGTVEITMSGEDEAYTQNLRLVNLFIPTELLAGKTFEALANNGRKWEPVSGTFDKSFKGGGYRWFVIDGVIFDFNPIGASDYCSGYSHGTIKGVWVVEPSSSSWSGMTRIGGGGTSQRIMGGFNGAKVVLREGSNADYAKYHAMKTYTYSQHLLSSSLLHFGAPKAGSKFSVNKTADGNIPFSKETGYGWLKGSGEPQVGYKEGTYYSHVAGHDDSVYRIDNLPSGFYAVTVGAGNYTKDANSFSVSVNGISFGENVSVSASKCRIASKVIFVKEGHIDVELSGNWLLSSIGVQPVMNRSEDFSMNRGYWVTDGYEPSSIYRNADYKAPLTLPLNVQEHFLPVPGTELAEKPKEPPRPVLLPDPETPSLQWMKNLKMYRFHGNADVLAELRNPALRERYMKEEIDGKGYNCAMISGMHSRHTYTNHIKRGTEYFRLLATDLHKRGIKVLDHHDSTLLWNSDSGLRTLAERLNELEYGVHDNLPSFQLCLNNPIFKETYFAYLKEQVKAGVDGFQLDEVEFWPHACACRWCRERFHKETGCYLPMNECDPAFNNVNNPLWKRWLDWRTATVTNWFVELRRYLKSTKPDLVLSVYTTHWGFTRSAPRHLASSDLVDLGRTFNLFGTEVMTRNTLQSSRPLLPYRKMKSILTKAYGANVWGWFYSSCWETDYFSWAVSNMVGQASLLSNVDKKGAPDYLTFSGSPVNMKLERSEQIAKVALLFSSRSRDWNSGLGFDNELFGMAQILEMMHVPYEMIGQMSINPKTLAKYDVLYIGASGCLSDQDVATILGFARAGGTVILSTIAGVFDELGVSRKQWAFQEAMGFPVSLPPKGTVKTVSDIKLASPLPCYAKAADLQTPYRTERTYGKGRLIYSAIPLVSPCRAREGTPPHPWSFDRNVPLEAFVKKELASVLGDAAYWQVDAPEQVYTTIWRENNGNLVVHFLNATGCTIKFKEKMGFKAPNPAYPPLAKPIVFTLPVKVTSAVAVSPDFSGEVALEFQANPDGSTTFTLPPNLLKGYTLVRVK